MKNKLKIRIIISLLVLIALSCSKQKFDYENHRTSNFQNILPGSVYDSNIVCVTFNIHLGFTATLDPWDKDVTGADLHQVEAIVRHLKKIDPDIIALQEVPRNRFNTVVKKFVEVLGNRMGMNYAFGSPCEFWCVET